MTVVPLSKLKPNPFRNIGLYPPDQKQVAQLVASIDRYGAWGGIRARPAGQYFEIAFGHTRVEAARQAGLKSLDIEIMEMSDDEMVRLMTTENATQAGSKAAAVMNEVTAVMQRLAKPMLAANDLGDFSPRWPEIAECFQSKKAYDVARGTLEKGDGIGHALVRRYLGKGEETACPRSVQEIKDAIAAVKASGIYAKIVAAAAAEIEAEAAAAAREAEAAERGAERAAKQAKTKGEKAKATKAKTQATSARKRQTATETIRQRAKQTASRAEDKFVKTFDERTVTLFDNDEQSRAFREAVTKPNAVKFIPLEQQMPLAKKIMDDVRAKPNRAWGATYISSAVGWVVMDALGLNRKINKEEREAAVGEQRFLIFKEKFDHLLQAVSGLNDAAGQAWSFLQAHPEWASDRRVSVTVVHAQRARGILNQLIEVLEPSERNTTAPQIEWQPGEIA